jgi:Flp pilus assembly pilin Flp
MEVPMDRLSRLKDERGQTTAEYSLVLLVAGAVVGVFAAFVKSGALSAMFQAIVRSLVERAGG